jgi:hypothetical protein
LSTQHHIIEDIGLGLQGAAAHVFLFKPDHCIADPGFEFPPGIFSIGGLPISAKVTDDMIKTCLPTIF